jgi:hypothetical protein
VIVKPSYRRPFFRAAFRVTPLFFVVFVACFDLALADLRAAFRVAFFGVDFFPIFAAPRLAVFFVGRRFRRAG